MCKTSSLLTNEFHEFQYLPAEITTDFEEVQHLQPKITTQPYEIQHLRTKTLNLVYILIRTFSKELSSEAINSFFLMDYEK